MGFENLTVKAIRQEYYPAQKKAYLARATQMVEWHLHDLSPEWQNVLELAFKAAEANKLLITLSIPDDEAFRVKPRTTSYERKERLEQFKADQIRKGVSLASVQYKNALHRFKQENYEFDDDLLFFVMREDYQGFHVYARLPTSQQDQPGTSASSSRPAVQPSPSHHVKRIFKLPWKRISASQPTLPRPPPDAVNVVLWLIAYPKILKECALSQLPGSKCSAERANIWQTVRHNGGEYIKKAKYRNARAQSVSLLDKKEWRGYGVANPLPDTRYKAPWRPKQVPSANVVLPVPQQGAATFLPKPGRRQTFRDWTTRVKAALSKTK